MDLKSALWVVLKVFDAAVPRPVVLVSAQRGSACHDEFMLLPEEPIGELVLGDYSEYIRLAQEVRVALEQRTVGGILVLEVPIAFEDIP